MQSRKRVKRSSNRHTISFKIQRLLLGLLLLVSGCKMLDLPAYPSRKVNDLPHKIVSGDKAIGVEPIYSTSENKKYFGFDLPKYGGLAIFVSAECTSESGSYILEKGCFRLALIRDGNANPRDNRYTAKIWNTLKLHFSLKARTDAKAIDHNASIKSLRTKTVTKNSPAQGFVYFELPDQQWDREELALLVEVFSPHLQTRETLKIALPKLTR